MSDPASFLSAFGGLIGGIGSIAAVWAALYVSHKAGLPQVVSYLDFDEDHNCMYLVVENCGTGVAYNVHFLDFDDSIIQESLRDAARTSFIHCGIPILAPGKVRRTLVAAGRIQDEMEDYSAKVTIAHTEKSMYFRRNREVKEDTVLEYRSYTGTVYTHSDTHEIKMTMDKLERQMRIVNKNLSAISRGIGSINKDE
ncbi:hypothetical protein [uncultured Enorma sp.]|uniref:hypothetical protein n=1 Tax=uncultured Enorma sp. TaxID=1714346 RepID=UPI0028037A04|nr:hypothetical protein [uncultured Enorma sp.]